jgi:hypothetical protein
VPVRIAVLEDLSLHEQRRLFANAKIIIGQHGAGLCNVIFARRSDGSQNHLLEISHWGLQTIKNLAEAKGMHHHLVQSTMKHCNTTHLVQILERIYTG